VKLDAIELQEFELEQEEQTMSASPRRDGSRHIVHAGETLSGIARQHGVTLDVLLAANPEIHDPNRISIGQIITIPAQATPTMPLPSGEDTGSEGLSPDADPNRILTQFQPAGASDKTANQDGLVARGIRGVQASETMAKTDSKRVMPHKTKFEAVARRLGLPPALLAAIASRESRGGAVLDAQGLGDHGHGFGLMQVDDRNSFAVVREGGPFGQPHIDQATGILRDKLDEVKRRFPDLSEVEQLQAAVSRYNGGRRLPPPDSDVGTTGGDYMNDVWARARFYARVERWTDGIPSPVAEQPAESPSPSERQPDNFVPAPSLEDVRDGRAVLVLGQKGDAVHHVQLLLGILADGKFGSKTQGAVIAFQHSHGIDVLLGGEGKVGTSTLATLEEAGQTISAAVSSIDPRHKTPQLHPELRRRLGMLADALAGRGMQALITDGLRTFAEQDAIFAQGRTTPGKIVTNARGGESNHNYGLAVDLYPVIEGRVHTDIPKDASREFRQRFEATQQAIIEDAERLGLTSGAHFSRGDPPHVQLLAEDVLKPRQCLEIFRAHHNSLDAVWEEVNGHLQGTA
jgi:peptidoglycan hydrolase-like protein with peptidoglycan-binding domain/LysM repeat protein